MISSYSNHPYIKWQIENKEVSSAALRLQLELDTSENWKELVENGIDIYKQDRDGATPLHYALFHGNNDVSQYLISISKIKKYQVIKTGCFNLSIVDYAFFRKACSNTTLALIEGKRQAESATPSPWCSAIIRMRADSTGLANLIECAPFPKREIPQIVKISLKTNNLKALKLLYDAHPYEMGKDYYLSRQALEFACAKGELHVAESILKGRWRFEIIKFSRGFNKALSKEEMDIKLKKAELEVPLQISLAQELLVEQGNNYPLHYALQSNNQQLIDFLLNFKDERILHTIDFEGKTPLIIAAEKSLKSTQKIISKYICKGNYSGLSPKSLAKPIEAAGKNKKIFTEIFLKRVVKAYENSNTFLVSLSSNPYAFSKVDKFIAMEQIKENIFEKIQLLTIANLDNYSQLFYFNKDVIHLIIDKIIKVEKTIDIDF
ncbi:MAG: ankyrin repeat domain-containing protein [Candidatus Protochlamydia sp.]|nr:ankyrin repeat domain-containing protein [Candidatus Protochlamydia sp.]